MNPESAFRCATAARRRDDPVAGTAPPTRRWLLLEHPGPWPVDAVAGSGIEPGVLAVLTRRAQREQVRILLVRRPGRNRPSPSRRWMIAGLDEATRTGFWQTDQDLIPVATALSERATVSRPADPVVLVCTHGRHDTCCAVRGRPVAAALSDRWPDQVWECSHVGGDRFAPNVVLVPDGFFYGGLTVESAVTAVGRHLAGRVDAERLRGLSRFEPPVQAAAIAVFAAAAPLAADAITLTWTERTGPHDGHGSETAVAFAVSGRAKPVRVRVLSVRRDPARLTCRATRDVPSTAYEVLDLDLGGEPAEGLALA